MAAVALGGLFAAVNSVFGQSATFTITTSMNSAHAAHTATPLPDGKVLVAGGCDSSLHPSATAELYDPATQTWTATGSMSFEREDHTATLLPNGKVLVVGGEITELYDSAAGAWTTTGTLNTSRGGHTATLLLNGKVLVAGGQHFDGTYSLVASAELYDPVSGTWTLTGSMNTARGDHRATLLLDGRVLVTGGDCPSGTNNSAEMYDPTNGTWTTITPMQKNRSCHTSTLLPNGNVLVVGGYWGTPSNPGTAELFNPVSGTWTMSNLASGQYGRCWHTATLLPDGQVLVTGGYSSAISAELYDPITGTWTATDPMNIARMEHTATLLPDGKVLIAGGEQGFVYPLSNAELFNANSNTTTTITLTSAASQPGSAFQFFFTNSVGVSFTVLCATNPVLSLTNWTVLGSAMEILPGQYQFNDPQAMNSPQRFYRVRSP